MVWVWDWVNQNHVFFFSTKNMFFLPALQEDETIFDHILVNWVETTELMLQAIAMFLA